MVDGADMVKVCLVAITMLLLGLRFRFSNVLAAAAATGLLVFAIADVAVPLPRSGWATPLWIGSWMLAAFGIAAAIYRLAGPRLGRRR